MQCRTRNSGNEALVSALAYHFAVRTGFNHYYGVRSAATSSPSRVLFHLRLPPFWYSYPSSSNSSNIIYVENKTTRLTTRDHLQKPEPRVTTPTKKLSHTSIRTHVSRRRSRLPAIGRKAWKRKVLCGAKNCMAWPWGNLACP